MEQRLIFRQLLEELKELAEEQGGSILTEQVDAYLKEALLSDEQLKMVYAYLTEQKIRVEGYRPAAEPSGMPARDQEKEDHFREENEGLAAYLDALSGIDSLDPMLEEELFHRAADKERQARDILAGAYLGVVCDLAGEMENESLHVDDLIQEGNMGLLLALDHLEKRESLAAYQAQLMNAVAAAMREAVQNSESVRRMDEGMAGRVNRLNEEILRLKEELGAEITAQELSAYLNIPLEEILDIIRLAGDEMKQK